MIQNFTIPGKKWELHFPIVIWSVSWYFARYIFSNFVLFILKNFYKKNLFRNLWNLILVRFFDFHDDKIRKCNLILLTRETIFSSIIFSKLDFVFSKIHLPFGWGEGNDKCCSKVLCMIVPHHNYLCLFLFSVLRLRRDEVSSIL